MNQKNDKNYGWRIMRFWDTNILNSPRKVTNKVIKEIKNHR